VNTTNAPNKAPGNVGDRILRAAHDRPVGNFSRKDFAAWVAAAALITGAGMLVAFGALAAKSEQSDPAEGVGDRSREALAAPTGLPFCHSAVGATAATETAGTFRLTASRTEVPNAEMQASAPNAEFADIGPPLWDGLGTLSYKITTASAMAQNYFDQGLRLAYAFNHAEAQRAFRKAEKLDPRCAMCFWGEALVLGPNINQPMVEQAVAPAFAAVQRAKALGAAASAREQMLIAALAERYADDPQADRKPLDTAYAAAMEKAAAKFADDDEIAVLYAESVMDLTPWNYWQPGGHQATPQAAPVVPTLERVLARNPAHPGAAHFYIHAVEASDRPERAAPFADRLHEAMPAAGHLVHMPSHIYYRIGRYLDALSANKTAVAVDETYLAATDAPMGVYRLGYYPHNIHFMLAAAQMAGDGEAAIAAAEKLRGLIPDDVARGIAMTHPIKAAPYFAHAQFSAPDTILALPDPGHDIPYAQAMWRYARSLAATQKGDYTGAEAEANAIAGIANRADFSALQAVGVPALNVLKLARTVAVGRLAQAQGDNKAAVAAFEEAAALQDGLPYSEPPFWYYPVRQTLGAALLQAGRLDEAEAQFKRALERAPNNGWSYFGLTKVYTALGNAAAAEQAEEKLAKTWIGNRSLLQLSKL
jgi:tetratricopeptide (TPR) repeat protein